MGAGPVTRMQIACHVMMSRSCILDRMKEKASHVDGMHLKGLRNKEPIVVACAALAGHQHAHVLLRPQ